MFVGNTLLEGQKIVDIETGYVYRIVGNGLTTNIEYEETMASSLNTWLMDVNVRMTYKIVVGWDGKFSILRWHIIGDEQVDFGDRNQIRFTIENVYLDSYFQSIIAAGSYQVHHIIPYGFRLNDLVQQAAKNRVPFHINFGSQNGIPLALIRHNGSHENYDIQVGSLLNELAVNYSYDPEIAYEKLTQLINCIKNAILNTDIPISQIDLSHINVTDLSSCQ